MSTILLLGSIQSLSKTGDYFLFKTKLSCNHHDSSYLCHYLRHKNSEGSAVIRENIDPLYEKGVGATVDQYAYPEFHNYPTIIELDGSKTWVHLVSVQLIEGNDKMIVLSVTEGD